MANENRDEALRRLKSIEGHVRGIEHMIEDEQGCIDIIRQILAIQGALEKLNLLLLEGHLHEFTATLTRCENDAERERIVHQLVGVFESTHLL